MAAAGAGTGSSPDVALGGQEVTQGRGRTGGLSTARGVTPRSGRRSSRGRTPPPAAPGDRVLQKPGNRHLLADGQRQGGQRMPSGCRGPRSAGPSSARHGRSDPGAPAGLVPGGAAGEPRRPRLARLRSGTGAGGAPLPPER